MLLPIVLFAAFTLLATAGTFVVADHFRGRRAAVGLALAVLAFFAVLAVALEWMIRAAGALG